MTPRPGAAGLNWGDACCRVLHRRRSGHLLQLGLSPQQTPIRPTHMRNDLHIQLCHTRHHTNAPPATLAGRLPRSTRSSTSTTSRTGLTSRRTRTTRECATWRWRRRATASPGRCCLALTPTPATLAPSASSPRVSAAGLNAVAVVLRLPGGMAPCAADASGGCCHCGDSPAEQQSAYAVATNPAHP